MSGLLELLKRAQLRLVEDLSEEEWCAGWYSGIEFILWNDIQNGDERQSRQDLKTLADTTGGWWVWDYDAQEERFLTLAEFAPLYDAEMERWEYARKRTAERCEAEGHPTDTFHAKFHGKCSCGKVVASPSHREKDPHR